MKLLQQLKIAGTALNLNKGRSALTILGVVIGIAAIMAMMSIGNGAEKLILGEISGLGAETVVIRPGKEPTGPTDIAGSLLSDSLTKRDVELLKRKENAPELVDIMPALIVPASVAYEGETYRPTILGASGDFFSKAFNVYPDEGSLFDEADIQSRANVAVIGYKVKQELFGDDDALNKRITIKDKKFRVVGIYPKVGQVAFFNFDELVVVPYTTAQTYLLGIDYYHEIITRASSPEAADKTVRDITLTLRGSHDIGPTEADDFYVVTQQGAVEQVKTIIGALTAFLSSVVAIGLVVGGIGIMNIMLVSVTERTREIGLRKALGATERDILTQFLLEAILLTLIGGIVGIILGALISLFASFVLTTFAGLDWKFVFPFSAALIGVSMSAAVGIIFGIYPAQQAAKKSPIEALRYE